MNEKKLLYERSAGHTLVGIFVILAMVVFGWLLVGPGDRAESYRIVAEFNTLNNVNEATKVKLRGFTIGQVEKIEFRPQPPAGGAYFLVELGIEKHYPVPEGTIAEIRSSGLVGDAFINLDVSTAGAAALPPGRRIKSREEPGMKQLITTVTEMAHKLGGAGESIRRADLGYKIGRVGDNMHRVATTLAQLAGNADSLLLTTRQMVARMEADVGPVMAGVDRSLFKLEQTLSRTDTLVANTSQDVQSSVRALRLAVERLDKVLQRVDTLVQYKETEIDETLTNLHQASAAVREISEHPWKIITGQGKKEEKEEAP